MKTQNLSSIAASRPQEWVCLMSTWHYCKFLASNRAKLKKKKQTNFEPILQRTVVPHICGPLCPISSWPLNCETILNPHSFLLCLFMWTDHNMMCKICHFESCVMFELETILIKSKPQICHKFVYRDTMQSSADNSLHLDDHPLSSKPIFFKT